MSISGDYVLIGAWADDDNGSYSGSAYLFDFKPNITNPLVSDVTQNSATLGATVTQEGLDSVTERGIVWGEDENPTTTTNDGMATAAGTTGSFTVEATALKTDTLYHFRGYAKNYYGTAYTEDMTFSTGLATVPTVIDPTATSIKGDSAVLGAYVSSDGGSAIIQRGAVWSTSPNPTVSDNDGMATSAGTTGVFTVNATGLNSGTTYHYRGYAINAVGAAYTTDETFDTKEQTGRIQVTIKPNSVKQSGARWRLIAGAPPAPDAEHEPMPPVASTWYTSKKTVRVAEGSYILDFLPAPGWVHPTLSVDVEAGKKLKVTVTFLPFMLSGASDYDGDGDSDIAVFNPSTRVWSIKDQYTKKYGVKDSWPVPGNYKGDAAVELAWWSPDRQTWNVRGGFKVKNFGQEGDIPVPADYDGDGLTDAALYRPSTGEWLISYTSTAPKRWEAEPAAVVTTVFGGGTYQLPVPGDYDGDGSAAPAVYNTSTGEWHLSEGDQHIIYGSAGDLPVQADYDGDGDTDIAVANMKLGEWRIREQYVENINSKDGNIPAPGDYSGNGSAEVVYYKPNNGKWYYTDGSSVKHGGKKDLPLVRGN